jgi:hypothetical protein
MRLEQPALLYDAFMTIGAIEADHDPNQVERGTRPVPHVDGGIGTPRA